MTCIHQEEKTPTGACYVCCPWMFPNGSPEARRAYEQWHIEQRKGIPLWWRSREERWAIADFRSREE